MLQSLYTLISNYTPRTFQEQQDQQIFLEYISSFDNILTRNNHFGHISSSPWIVNEDFTKVLMVHHNIFNSWGWCGGHADGQEDLLAVAIKEGLEESGLTTLTPLSNVPIAIDILPVAGHIKNNQYVSAHVHLNVTYLCQASEKDSLKFKPDENSGVMWVDINQIKDYVSEPDMIKVYEKLVEASLPYKPLY